MEDLQFEFIKNFIKKIDLKKTELKKLIKLPQTKEEGYNYTRLNGQLQGLQLSKIYLIETCMEVIENEEQIKEKEDD